MFPADKHVSEETKPPSRWEALPYCPFQQALPKSRPRNDENEGEKAG